jgi:hypothetical protein
MDTSHQTLLVFAHYGEAQTFIEHFQLEKNGDDLFSHEQIDLLITGEGHYSVIRKLTDYLARHKPLRIINLGLAGALRNEMISQNIYAVRTCYSFNPEIEFKSFTTSYAGDHPQADCLSYFSRLKDEVVKKELSHFASLVDREVWAIGYVCHDYQLPFFSFKLVSDEANEGTRCELISAKAQEYSEKLLHFYLSLAEIANTQEKSKIDLPFATLTQHRMIEQQLKYLALSQNQTMEEVWSHLKAENEIKNILASKRRPKDQTKLILEYLQRERYPELIKFKDNLHHLLKPFQEKNLEIKCHDFEDAMLEIHLKIKSFSELEVFMQKMKLFPFDQFSDLLEGSTDV